MEQGNQENLLAEKGIERNSKLENGEQFVGLVDGESSLEELDALFSIEDYRYKYHFDMSALFLVLEILFVAIAGSIDREYTKINSNEDLAMTILLGITLFGFLENLYFAARIDFNRNTLKTELEKLEELEQ